MFKGLLKLQFVLIVLLVPLLANSAILNVPANYSTIQSAIDAAIDGDMVLVSPGVYLERIDFLGKSISVSSTNGAELTIIDGNQEGAVVNFSNGETRNTVFSGFTVIGVGEGGNTFDPGGGINIRNASPVIENNIIRDNEYTGISLRTPVLTTLNSSALIKDNIIKNNNAGNSSPIEIFGFWCC